MAGRRTFPMLPSDPRQTTSYRVRLEVMHHLYRDCSVPVDRFQRSVFLWPNRRIFGG